MRTKNIFKSTLIVLATSLISVSCDDYLDVNDNPNNPPISTPSLTLPVAQQGLAYLNGTTMTYAGNYLVYNWSTPSNWSANEDYFRYNITTTFLSNIFEKSYASIFKNLTYIENYKDPTGAVDYTSYKVISSILKAFQYQYLVDLYGDIPYTEANLRGENQTPTYDDAETIYKDLIDNLTQVAILSNDLPENAENPGSQDIFFGGDMKSWGKFANSIKLRMLVRLSNTGQDQYIKDQIALIDKNGLGYIDSDVTANPGYSDALEKQSPFYGYFFQPSTGVQRDRNDYTVATDYVINFLNDTSDPRLKSLFKPAQSSGSYKGAPQSSMLPGTGFTNNDLSKVGSGLLKSSEQDQIIMLLSENLFTQAEAIQRGYMSGDAQAIYEKAIEKSFLFLNVNDAVTSAQTYYNQAIPNISWNASTNKIEAIITQKWLALIGTSTIESWIELTRTGFPSDTPIPAESGGIRPVRLLYPASEVSRNSKNVPKQTKQDAFTQYPFWK